MSFVWPAMLLSLLLLPVLIAGYLRVVRRRAEANDLGPLGSATSDRSSPGWRRHLPIACFGAAVAVMLFALARPETTIELPRSSGTVIFAFDTSNSMVADDVSPTRLSAAKEAARQFAVDSPDEIEIGVVSFSGGGLITQQPTTDRAEVIAAIDRLAADGATSLAQGLFTSLNAIAGEPIALEEGALEGDLGAIDIGSFGSAVVVVFSDGENTSDSDPLAIAQLAANAGVRVYSIGVGTQQGAVIDVDGFTLATELDEALLREVSGLTNGQYFDAEDRDGLLDIVDSIDLQLTFEGERTEITALVAIVGLVLLIIGAGLSERILGRVP